MDSADFNPANPSIYTLLLSFPEFFVARKNSHLKIEPVKSAELTGSFRTHNTAGFEPAPGIYNPRCF